MKEIELTLTSKFKRTEYNIVTYFVRLKDQKENRYLMQVSKEAWDSYELDQDYFMEDKNA